VTPPATFVARYTAMLDSLTALGTIQGGVLIGAVQAGVAPYFTQGRAWKQFELSFDMLTNPLNALDVSLACLANQPLGGADTAWTAVPLPVGGAALALAQARVDSVLGGQLLPQNLQTVVISCADNTAITATEMANIFATVAQYNAAIEAAADDLGWIFVDPNDLLLQLSQQPGQIFPFPAFSDAVSAALGYPAGSTVTMPFGAALSRDGIHPSTATHRLVANALIQAINAAYSTNSPALN